MRIKLKQENIYSYLAPSHKKTITRYLFTYKFTPNYPLLFLVNRFSLLFKPHILTTTIESGILLKHLVSSWFYRLDGCRRVIIRYGCQFKRDHRLCCTRLRKSTDFRPMQNHFTAMCITPLAYFLIYLLQTHMHEFLHIRFFNDFNLSYLSLFEEGWRKLHPQMLQWSI